MDCQCWPPNTCGDCRKKISDAKRRKTLANDANSPTRQWFDTHGYCLGSTIGSLPDGNEGVIEVEAKRVGRSFAIGVRCEDGQLRFYTKDDIKCGRAVRARLTR